MTIEVPEVCVCCVGDKYMAWFNRKDNIHARTGATVAEAVGRLMCDFGYVNVATLKVD